ncbi:MAG: hypothetical protein M1826_006846 [Phylliscum demangeonii]|nr:MAG: hypothetical protein M1826_006846 [Phylliscum demangeonii]
MATTSTGVLRYSGLVLGVFYGMYHQSALTAQQKVEREARDLAHRQSLIQQAKEAYAKKMLPASHPGGAQAAHSMDVGDADPVVIVVMDPEDAKFDLEAYLKVAFAEDTLK